jgi:hypothetical protein
MTGKLVSIGGGDICRARLDFLSMLKLMSLVGICAGITAIPISLLLHGEKLLATFQMALFAVVGLPIAGFLNGVLYAVIGYPLYAWVTRRVNVHTYSGEFQVSKKNVSEI